MQITDLKELKALLKLCRTQGVTEITLGDIHLKLGELPQEDSASSEPNLAEETQERYANFPDGVLSPEQLVFYSAGGLPENDPHRQES